MDTAVNDIDMDLTHTDAAEHFAAEPSGDIWDQPAAEDNDDDTPAFLRRRKKKHSEES